MPVIVCRAPRWSWGWKCWLTAKWEGSGVIVGAWMVLVWAECNLGVFFYLVHVFFMYLLQSQRCSVVISSNFAAVGGLMRHGAAQLSTGIAPSHWCWRLFSAQAGSQAPGLKEWIKQLFSTAVCSYFSVVIMMCIKGLVPIKKGVTVFYSQIIISV